MTDLPDNVDHLDSNKDLDAVDLVLVEALSAAVRAISVVLDKADIANPSAILITMSLQDDEVDRTISGHGGRGLENYDRTALFRKLALAAIEETGGSIVELTAPPTDPRMN
jgi:hypothetical protein